MITYGIKGEEKEAEMVLLERIVKEGSGGSAGGSRENLNFKRVRRL